MPLLAENSALPARARNKARITTGGAELGLGLDDSLGETEILIDAEAEVLGLLLSLADGERDRLSDALGDSDADGEKLSDSLLDGDGLALQLRLALAELDGEMDSLGD